MIENEILLKKKVTEPRYCNYFTWFRFYQELDKELDYPNLLEEFTMGSGARVCFSNLFRAFESNSENIDSYLREKSILVDKLSFGKNETILVGIRLDDFKGNESNYCLVSPESIKEWCETFKNCIDYNIDLIIDDPENPKSCLVRIDIPSLTKYGNFERLLLTWIRYLYEYPYNYCTIDALRLKRMEDYQNYSLFDLYGVVSHCISSSWGTGHSVAKGGGICPKEYMLEHFNATTKKSVNNFGSLYRYTGQQFSNKLTVGSMYELLDENIFTEKRLDTYKEAMKVFENHYNDKQKQLEQEKQNGN